MFVARRRAVKLNQTPAADEMIYGFDFSPDSGFCCMASIRHERAGRCIALRRTAAPIRKGQRPGGERTDRQLPDYVRQRPHRLSGQSGPTRGQRIYSIAADAAGRPSSSTARWSGAATFDASPSAPTTAGWSIRPTRTSTRWRNCTRPRYPIWLRRKIKIFMPVTIR